MLNTLEYYAFVINNEYLLRIGFRSIIVGMSQQLGLMLEAEERRLPYPGTGSSNSILAWKSKLSIFQCLSRTHMRLRHFSRPQYVVTVNRTVSNPVAALRKLYCYEKRWHGLGDWDQERWIDAQIEKQVQFLQKLCLQEWFSFGASSKTKKTSCTSTIRNSPLIWLMITGNRSIRCSNSFFGLTW